MEEISIITSVITVASVICAALPEPKTRLGKRIRRVVEWFALNIGNAKK